jgi:hypothetical protein
MIRPRRLPIVTRVTRLATTERLASDANLEAGRTRGGAEGNALELIGRSLPTSDRASDSDSPKRTISGQLRFNGGLRHPCSGNCKGRWA